MKPESHIVSIEGLVTQRWDTAPLMSAEYREFCKRREIKENEKTSETKEIRNDHMRLPLLTKRPKPKEPVIKEKKTRMERAELVEMLLSCFERQEFWSWVDLLNHTQQPGKHLREVLDSICVLHNRGPNRNMWELRAEYKHNKPDSGSTST